MSEEVKLLNCPFCGGEASDAISKAYREVGGEREELRTTYFVNCVRCGSSNQGLVGHSTPELAREHWNRRAVPTDTEARMRADFEEQRERVRAKLRQE